MILMVACELGATRDPAPLHAAMESLGPSLRFMKTTWLVSTRHSPQELAAALQIHFEPEDVLLITELTSSSPAHLPKRAANWISNQHRLEREKLSNVFLIERTSRRIDSTETVPFVSVKRTAPTPLAVRRGVSLTEPYKADASPLPSPIIYIVVFELVPDRHFAPLEATVGSFGPSACFLPTFCLIYTNRPATDLANALRAHLTPRETVFVSRLTDKVPDYLPRQALDWIATHGEPNRAHPSSTKSDLS